MSGTVRHTLTLTRWHLVARRIQEFAGARQREAVTCLGGTHLQHAPTESQKAGLRDRGRRALEDVALIREAFGAVGRIREALAVRNAEVGVSALLAQIEAKRSELRLVTEVSSLDLLTRLDLDDVALTLAKQPVEAERSPLLRGRASPGVPVSVVDPSKVDELRAVRESLSAEIAALTDEVNDRNRHTLALDVPRSLATVAGLLSD